MFILLCFFIIQKHSNGSDCGKKGTIRPGVCNFEGKPYLPRNPRLVGISQTALGKKHHNASPSPIGGKVRALPMLMASRPML
jgi:hypothetical protein